MLTLMQPIYNLTSQASHSVRYIEALLKSSRGMREAWEPQKPGAVGAAGAARAVVAAAAFSWGC